MSVTPYQMAVNNCAQHIKDNPADTPNCIDAFAFSTILGVAFCKAKEEVIMDILEAGGNL